MTEALVAYIPRSRRVCCLHAGNVLLMQNVDFRDIPLPDLSDTCGVGVIEGLHAGCDKHSLV